MNNCQNCGHECHCGSNCVQNHKDGDGNNLQIECCKNCRCDIDVEAETMYDME